MFLWKETVTKLHKHVTHQVVVSSSRLSAGWGSAAVLWRIAEEGLHERAVKQSWEVHEDKMCRVLDEEHSKQCEWQVHSKQCEWQVQMAWGQSIAGVLEKWQRSPELGKVRSVGRNNLPACITGVISLWLVSPIFSSTPRQPPPFLSFSTESLSFPYNSY